jgi:Na+-driven multidrug efflux pump
LLFISRAPEMALPEVTIALSEDRQNHAAIRRFSLSVGIAFSLLLALISFTALSDLYFHTIIGVSEELARVAETGAALAILTPLALSFVSVSRGFLTAMRNTRPQAGAMLLELATLVIALLVGVAFNLPGVPVAAFGLSAAMIIEAIYLWLVLRQSQPSATSLLRANPSKLQ